MKRSVVLLGLLLGALGGIFLHAPEVRALISSHQCSFCHDVHLAPGASLLRDTVVEALCLTCHGPAGTSVLKAEVHTNASKSAYPLFRISCRGCHDPHDNRANWLGGTNLKLVGTRQDSTGRAEILTPNSGIRDVVFESRGTGAGQPALHSFADADQDLNGYYDGVCETCHTLTKYHRNNASDGHRHHTGETCTRCHEHVTDFNP